MAKRAGWNFAYLASDVAKAANRKIVYHRGRHAFWANEKTLAHDKIKFSTVQLTEYPVTGGVRVEAAIDPTLKTRYDECSAKVQRHAELMKDYERWHSILDANPQETVCLDIDDIHYFGLAAHAENLE